jgi:hypothetical protein
VFSGIALDLETIEEAQPSGATVCLNQSQPLDALLSRIESLLGGSPS